MAAAVAAGAEELKRWGESLADATKGLDSKEEIAHALDRAAEKIDPTRFVEIVSEALTHGAAIGAVDSFVDREKEEPEPSPKLAQCRVVLQDRIASKLPFGDAIKQFESRDIMPRALFDQLSDAAKQRAFTVAGLATEELLGDAHAELDRMVKDSGSNSYFDESTGKWVYKGPNFQEFDKFARERLEKAGWTPANPSHVETIFRTNVQSAYSSGRVAEMLQPDVLKARPYWQIKSVGDSRTRKSHLKASGTILPADHPFWRTCFPPFGYNCRCLVISRSKRWVDAHGGQTSAPMGLPDPGFASGTHTLLSANLDYAQESLLPPTVKPLPAHPLDDVLTAQPAFAPSQYPAFAPPPQFQPQHPKPIMPEPYVSPEIPQYPSPVHPIVPSQYLAPQSSASKVPPLPDVLHNEPDGTPLRPSPMIPRLPLSPLGSPEQRRGLGAIVRSESAQASPKEAAKFMAPEMTSAQSKADRIYQDSMYEGGNKLVDDAAIGGIKSFSLGSDFLIRRYMEGATRQEMVAMQAAHSGNLTEEGIRLASGKVDRCIRSAHELERAFQMGEDSPVKTVFRGMGGFSDEQLNEWLGSNTFDMGGMPSSTSSSPGVAKIFMDTNCRKKNGHGIVLKLHRKSKGIGIEGVSECPTEHEILVHGNSRWRVLRSERLEDYHEREQWLIEAEEIYP